MLGQFLLCHVILVMDHLKHTSKIVYLTPNNRNIDAEFLYQTALEKIYYINQQIKNEIKKEKVKVKEKRYHSGHKLGFSERYGKEEREFVQKVLKAKEYIASGDIFQIVLSKQFTCDLKKPSFYLYRRLRQINPSPYMFYMNFGNLKLVGASPEMLVKVSGDTDVYKRQGCTYA